jgi:hypothetical protein
MILVGRGILGLNRLVGVGVGDGEGGRVAGVLGTNGV